MTQRLAGRLVLPDRILDGEVVIAGGRIRRIRPTRHRSPHYMAPGLIDLQLWGQPAQLARSAPRGGTTAFVSTIGPRPAGALRQQLTTWSSTPPADGARWLGAHLEGPWIERRQAGALAAGAVRAPQLTEARALWRAAQHHIRVVTLAPEHCPPAFIRWWARRSVVSCGHTAADYATTRRGIAAGVRAATHLWNKMGSPHQRRPGAVGALLEDPRVAVMLLVDGRHLHPATARLVARVIGVERLVLATDATAAVPLADDAQVGLRRRQFGGLAGTRLTMLDAVRRLMTFTGWSLPQAVRAASANPARLLGESRLGRLAVGAAADFVVFDPRFRVLQTFVNGQLVYER